MNNETTTIRNHSFAFESDSKLYQLLWNVCEVVFLFLMIHYFFWIFGVVVVGFAMVQYNLGYLVLVLGLIYLPSYLDNSQNFCGRPWHNFRTSKIWWLMSNYGNLKMISEQKLDPSVPYIFGYHPHGILILSRCASYGGNWEALFPGIETRVLAASPMFYVPCAREICLWMGAVDASKKSAIKCIEKGLSIIVYPGGSKEIFETNPDSVENILILKDRKGFIKLSIQTGAPLVPTFVFGEKWMYDKWDPPKGLWKFFLRVFKIPLIVFWGRFYTWMPYRKNMGIVYGKPLSIKQCDNPSPADIDALHEEYCIEIHRLFDTYKTKFGYSSNEVLVIT